MQAWRDGFLFSTRAETQQLGFRRIEPNIISPIQISFHIISPVQIPVELDCVYFVTCPKQGLEMEAVVLHRVAFLQ